LKSRKWERRRARKTRRRTLRVIARAFALCWKASIRRHEEAAAFFRSRPRPVNPGKPIMVPLHYDR